MQTIAAAILLALTLCGCGTYTVTPPADVSTPATVYVVDLGNTSKLALPRVDDDGVIEAYDAFGFGDWEFYAKSNTSPLYVPFVLFWPTAGTLTKQAYAASPHAQLVAFSASVHEVDVEFEAARDLHRRLAERFAANESTRLGDPGFGMNFVRDDESYWLFHQSSSVVAGWLRELGCEVTGWTLVADYRVREPD